MYQSGQYININTFILSKETYEALSDKTKKELYTHAVQYLIVNEESSNYTRTTNLTNAVLKFKWMWELIVQLSNASKNSEELSKLKQSIANIKGIL